MLCFQISDPGPYIVEDVCLVSGSSLVYDSKFTAFYNNVPFNPDTEYLNDEIARTIFRNIRPDSGQLHFEFFEPPKPVAELYPLAVPLCLLHSENYFHFLIQSLPTLVAARASGALLDDAVIVTPPLRRTMRSVFELLFEKKLQTIELTKLNAVRCRRVLLAQDSYYGNELISGLPPTGHYNSKNLFLLKELLLTTRAKEKIPPGDFSKIFVYRKSSWRNVVNIDEIATIAKRRNYKIILPENHSFEEQIAIFNAASRIVGPTGAWIANLLFSNSDALVKVMYPDTMSSSNFWSEFAKIINLQFDNYFFSTDLPQNPAIRKFQPMHSDFYVSPNEFEHMLN